MPEIQLVAQHGEENRSFSQFFNDDRFFYIEKSVTLPLPKIMIFKGRKCRVWHPSQKDFCPRCDSADHCVSDVDECKAYITNDKIYAFRSRDDPLCNMMKCKFAFDNNTYHSAEQAYVYAKCKLSKNIDLMPLVLSAADAFCAKRVGDSISDEDLSSCGWHDIKSDIMKDILVAKCKSVPKFRDALLNSGSQHIVEATDDLY